MNNPEKLNEMECFSKRVNASRYQISEHVIRFLMAGKIHLAEIETTLLNGKVIEEHCHETRGTSYLICAILNGKPIHLLCAEDKNDWLIIIFAYVPSLPIWKTPLQRNNPGGNEVNEKLRACFFCGGEIKEVTVGNFDYRLEGQLYVIKKVPAGLCLQCGEKYVESDVARKMNILIEDEQFSGTEAVSVLDYNKSESA